MKVEISILIIEDIYIKFIAVNSIFYFRINRFHRKKMRKKDVSIRKTQSGKIEINPAIKTEKM